jgi:hypothetical protein
LEAARDPSITPIDSVAPAVALTKSRRVNLGTPIGPDFMRLSMAIRGPGPTPDRRLGCLIPGEIDSIFSATQVVNLSTLAKPREQFGGGTSGSLVLNAREKSMSERPCHWRERGKWSPTGPVGSIESFSVTKSIGCFSIA